MKKAKSLYFHQSYKLLSPSQFSSPFLSRYFSPALFNVLTQKHIRPFSSIDTSWDKLKGRAPGTEEYLEKINYHGKGHGFPRVCPWANKLSKYWRPHGCSKDSQHTAGHSCCPRGQVKESHSWSHSCWWERKENASDEKAVKLTGWPIYSLCSQRDLWGILIQSPDKLENQRLARLRWFPEGHKPVISTTEAGCGSHKPQSNSFSFR